MEEESFIPLTQNNSKHKDSIPSNVVNHDNEINKVSLVSFFFQFLITTMQPPGILSRLPLPLVALSLFTSPLDSSKEVELNPEANAKNLGHVECETNGEKQDDIKNHESAEEEIKSELVEQEPKPETQSWYERIKTAAISST
jgi:hypothetical protein